MEEWKEYSLGDIVRNLAEVGAKTDIELSQLRILRQELLSTKIVLDLLMKNYIEDG